MPKTVDQSTDLAELTSFPSSRQLNKNALFGQARWGLKSPVGSTNSREGKISHDGDLWRRQNATKCLLHCGTDTEGCCSCGASIGRAAKTNCHAARRKADDI